MKDAREFPGPAPASLRVRILAGAGWVFGGNVISRLIGFASMLILARCLAPEAFGLVALATALMTVLASVTELSLANALIHLKQVERDDYDTAFTFGALRGALLALAVIAGGFGLAAIYHEPRLRAVCAVLSLQPLILGLNSPHFVNYSKNLQFSRIVAVDSASKTVSFLVAVAIALLTRSYWAIVASVVASSAASCIATYVLAPYRPRLSFKSWRKLLSFSGWVTLAEFISTLTYRIDDFFIGGMLGRSTLGHYTVGNNLAFMATRFAADPLKQAIFPGFAKISHDLPRLRHAFQRSQATLMAVGLPLGIGSAMVARPLVLMVLGQNWEVAALVIEVTAPVAGIQMVFALSHALAYALGATRLLFFRDLMMLSVRLPAVLLGLFFGGLTGLLIARVVAGGFVLSFLNLLLVSRLIQLPVLSQLRACWRSVVSVCAMAGVLAPLHDWPLHAAGLPEKIFAVSASIAIGALVYGGAHFLLWILAGRPAGPEREMLALAERLFRKMRLTPRAVD